MGALIFFWLLFTAGVLLAVVGGRRPSLAERVQALRPKAPPATPTVAPAERVFDAKLLQPLSPPFLAVGAWVGSARRRLGLDSEELNRRLALAGRSEGLSVFFATKVFYAVVGLVLPSLLAVLGFFAPNAIVAEQARARRLVLEEGVVEAALAIASALGAGSGIAEAVEGAKAGEGPFAEELERALSDAQLGGYGPAEAIDALGTRIGLVQARDLAATLRAAEQGAPLTETLLAQARSLAERHRSDSQAAGERATIRIHLTVAAFILPGFLLLFLFPAAHMLTTFTGGR
jgi:Flp pilus assembly protein TadB